MKKEYLDKRKKIQKEGEEKELTSKGGNKRIKLIVSVAIVTAMIFILWFLTLPSIFSSLKNDNQDSGFFNKDAKEALDNIKEVFKEFGQKLEETTKEDLVETTTSTEENVKEEGLSGEELLRLKEKIIEATSN